MRGVTIIRFCLLACLVLLPMSASAIPALRSDADELEPRDPINPRPQVTPDDQPPVVTPEPAGQDTGQTGGQTGGIPNGQNAEPPAAEDIVSNPTQAGTKVIESAALVLEELVNGQGGRINPNTIDTLVNEHGLCRWLDNTDTGTAYFVPFATLPEWQSFVTNAPTQVVRANCCPAATVSLTATDGQFLTISLPIGREGSDRANGEVDVSHVFTLTRTTDGASWPQTVSDTFRCSGGAWTSTALYHEDNAPAVTPPVGPPATCSGTLVSQTLEFTGTARRASFSRATDSFASSGSKPYIGGAECGGYGISRFTCSPSHAHALTRFVFPQPVKNTNVKITATYDAYGSFSDGTPKVAEFSIDDGGYVTGDTTPAVRTFEMTGRMGGPFIMTNNELFMPAYDTTPNLTRLVVEYTTCSQGPVPPMDALVMAKECSKGVWWSRACISNTRACLTSDAATTSSFIPGTHDGTFCSSVSATDSGPDGAKTVVDLKPYFDGYTGDAVIIAPLGIWTGIRDATTARTVMANPDNYVSLPFYPTSSPQETAVRLTIPDINANARFSIPDTKFESGCGKNCHNSFQFDMDYNGVTKELTIYTKKGSRWKKNDGLRNQVPIFRPWHQQHISGYANGKIWSEVRVISPAPAQCGVAAAYQQLPGGVSGALCFTGTAGQVTDTPSTTEADTGVYSWTCTNSANAAVSCAAAYAPMVIPGDFGFNY